MPDNYVQFSAQVSEAEETAAVERIARALCRAATGPGTDPDTPVAIGAPTEIGTPDGAVRHTPSYRVRPLWQSYARQARGLIDDGLDVLPAAEVGRLQNLRTVLANALAGAA